MKPVQTRVFLIADSPPFHGTQSGPVLYRHLRRLQAEADVRCLSLVPAPPDYPVAHQMVPPRFPGLVPVRGWLPFSRTINRRQKAAHLVRTLKLGPADRLISCMHAREHALARELSRLSGAPLTCILHDLWPGSENRDAPRTLRQARSVLAVSENLAALARTFAPGRVERMPPLGEDPLPPIKPPTGAFRIGVAGTLNPAYLEVATRLGRPVLALGWAGDIPPGIETRPFQPTNLDALRLLQRECRALLIYQSPRDGDYARYSFPSRLVDFVQTGLPVVIVAAPETNLGRWAGEHHWPLWVPDETSDAAFKDIARRLDDETEWREASRRAQALAAGEFNAARIHSILVAALRLDEPAEPAP
jgi:hypothetical protein